jgi:predicted DsbA family dithiol-disulfide isomerase
VAAARRDGVTTVPRFVFENGVLIVGVTSTEALGDALRQASGRLRAPGQSIAGAMATAMAW